MQQQLSDAGLVTVCGGEHERSAHGLVEYANVDLARQKHLENRPVAIFRHMVKRALRVR